MKLKKINIWWFQSKVYLAIFALFSIVLIGIFGYKMLLGYSWIDAIYMTIITVTTVGFGEVNVLDDTGKMFTIFLILTSITIYIFAVSILTEYITNGEIFRRLKLNKMDKKIKKLKNHTIIVGYGRNGRQASLKLEKSDRDYLVIENKLETIEELKENGILYVKGDGTEDETLESAGLMNADSVIIALPSDADNLFISMSARQKNPKVHIISRATNESSYKKLILAGANNVIMPDKIGGDHMASLVVSPDLIEFVDKISLDGDCETNLRELCVDNELSYFENKSIMDLDIRKKTGCNVIGLKMANGEYVVNPEANTILKLGAKIIVLGSPNQIEKLKKTFLI